jgi:transmembrane sensor
MNRPTSDRDPVAPAADVDAHAFERFAQGQGALDVAAATWAVRRRNGLSGKDRAALQAWLDADPRHAAALEGMAAAVGHVRQLSGDDVAALKHGLQSKACTRSAAIPKPSQRKPEPSRWRVHLGPLIAPAAVAVLVVALVGAGWTGWESWRSLPTFEQAFATERGQQIVATLPDDPARGSTVQLDTATRLDARLFRDRREVRLQEGQALFSVHADKDRPFHVWAGQLHITVVGTRFSVRHTRWGLEAGQTVVSVEEGHVRVTRTGGGEAEASTGDAPVELVAGQMLVGDDSGGIGPVTRVSPAAVAPWRAGRISFDNTPLDQALAEFERYRSTGLVIKDPAVARLLVGGSYRVQQFGSFVDALPLMLPVRLVPQGEVTEIVLRHP